LQIEDVEVVFLLRIEVDTLHIGDLVFRGVFA
jgi:hypothetical protein